MPDLSAKAKKGSADFKKSKIKIGRKLAKPANQTSTDFKSKRLQILNQSVTEDKGSFVNQRKLNLADLLSQSKHYSPNVRRDALFGLKTCWSGTRGDGGHVGAVLEALCERVADPEASVRHALRVAFAHVAGLLDEAQVGPFAGLLVVHLCSGMTHIAERVRLDALPLLDTLVDRFPAALAPHAPKLLPNYAHILANRSPPVASSAAPASSTGQGPAAPASARAATGQPPAPAGPAAPGEPAPGPQASTSAALLAAEWLAPSGCRVSLEAHRRPRRPAPQMPPSRPFRASPRGPGPGGGGGGGAPSGDALAALRAAADVLALLLASPAAARPPPPPAPAASPAPSSPASPRGPADDESLLTPDGLQRFGQAAGANVALCEALSFGLEGACGAGGEWPPWARAVASYVLALLSDRGLAAGERGAARAAGRRALDTLAGALLPPPRAPAARPGAPALAGAAVRGLVKLLCQLRGRAPEAADAALRLLAAAARLPLAAAPRALRASLAPLFAIEGAGGRRTGGPVVHLTEGQQRAAVELLFHAAAGDELLPAPLLSALAFACNAGTLPEATVRHAAEVICAAAAARGPPPPRRRRLPPLPPRRRPPAAAAARAPPPPPPCAP
eukprot:tig00000983_g5921.t1